MIAFASYCACKHFRIHPCYVICHLIKLSASPTFYTTGPIQITQAGPLSSQTQIPRPPNSALPEHKPDMLLLMGPFVDVDHPHISSGLSDKTFNRVFQDEVVSRLHTWCTYHEGTRVALMPSVRDVHHHPVFPQPAFSKKQLNGPQVRRRNSTSQISACKIHITYFRHTS